MWLLWLSPFPRWRYLNSKKSLATVIAGMWRNWDTENLIFSTTYATFLAQLGAAVLSPRLGVIPLFLSVGPACASLTNSSSPEWVTNRSICQWPECWLTHTFNGEDFQIKISTHNSESRFTHVGVRQGKTGGTWEKGVKSEAQLETPLWLPRLPLLLCLPWCWSSPSSVSTVPGKSIIKRQVQGQQIWLWKM